MSELSSSQAFPIVLNLIAAVIGALGQYLYKIGGNKLGKSPLLQNWQLFAGMILFCAVMGLFVWAFKLGGRLSVVYPVYATTFVWGTILAIFVDREPFSPIQLLGIGIVVVGVSMVAIGAPK